MSNFAGYLLKIGNTVFPNKFIKFDTWQSTPKQIQSIGAYTDADGVLHETPAPHKASKLEFETKPMELDEKIEMQTYFDFSGRRNIDITYWDDSTNTYATATCYVPDITYSIYSVANGTIKYNPIRIAFIEY